MSAAHALQSDEPRAPNFNIDDCLKSWNSPAKEWLTEHQKHWDGLATGCIVFDPLGRVLLVQRASHDSMPNRWEIPGGAVDDEDTSLLTSAARELWEEAGLVATRFTQIVSEGPGQEPGQVYTNSKGTKVWCRFCFVAEVEDCDRVDLIRMSTRISFGLWWRRWGCRELETGRYQSQLTECYEWFLRHFDCGSRKLRVRSLVYPATRSFCISSLGIRV